MVEAKIASLVTHAGTRFDPNYVFEVLQAFYMRVLFHLGLSTKHPFYSAYLE
jgi:hypothetical protein